ncbi:amidohydrolase family protein [Paraglaciecola hydrolytica]|uniref:Amidohydrolase n=1 Tax=Paraglaciecola hydrolytica TaxID=1799789 RepID=A0A136A3F4_9ALTE|nr:amidohydrolase family protein [Paraglaciecola hydrolytica]KXI29753.1 amidohydrolase [Paraglaciecola hydrolytica]
MKRIIHLGVLFFYSAVTFAQDYAIVGATVHTMGTQGKVENATILIKDGKIQLVQNGNVPVAGYTLIHAENKVITPGLIGAKTQLGLVDVGFSAGTNDSTAEQTGFSNTGAAYDVAYAINADSSLFAISRIAGVTSAATSMSDTHQLFAGQGAIISLNDNSPLLKPKAFISVQVGNAGADAIGGSRAVLWTNLDAIIAEAKFAIGKSLSPSDEWHGDMSKADIKAMIPVVQGKTPLLIDARRKADIQQVIAFKQRNPNIKVVLLYATEGWRIADELAANKISVILDPESNLPYEFDQLAATLSNAGRLDKAGVDVAIGMETHNIRLARQHAGNAVANGLPWEKGLAALTINVAKLYEVDALVGSLEVGKQADLVIWSGDPLELTESAEQVFIKGEKIVMESRQTKLRDRYLKLNTGKPQQFSRP